MNSERAAFQARWNQSKAKIRGFHVVPPPPPPPAPPEEPEEQPDPWAPIIMGYRGGNPVYLLPRDRCEHFLLMGKTGTGKSNHLRYYARQDAEANRGFVVIDPHGKTIDDLLTDIPKWRERDVIILDAADEDWPFGLNLFQRPAMPTAKATTNLIDQILQAFTKCWGGGFAGSAEEWIKIIAQTFIENRRGTMAVIPKLLNDADFRAPFLKRLKDQIAQDTWQTNTVKSGRNAGELRYENIKPFLSRLNMFLLNPVVRNIVGQEKTTLDFSTWMNEGKIVLIKLPDLGDDGIGEDAVALLGTVILQLILKAAFSREVGSQLYAVYCDEFQHYVTPDIPKIIQNVRKYGVGLILSTQSFSNIHDEAIRDALLGVGTLINYQLTNKDAKIVAGEFEEGIVFDKDWALNKDIELEYTRPSDAAMARRIASMRKNVGRNSFLVKDANGEGVMTVPNMEALPVPYQTATRANIIARSRSLYCTQAELVRRDILRDLVPDEAVDEELFDEPPKPKPRIPRD